MIPQVCAAVNVAYSGAHVAAALVCRTQQGGPLPVVRPASSLVLQYVTYHEFHLGEQRFILLSGLDQRFLFTYAECSEVFTSLKNKR